MGRKPLPVSVKRFPLVAAAAAFILAWAPARMAALEAFTENHRAQLTAQLPNSAIKLETKSTLHVAFLGDAAVLESAAGESGMASTFLSELQKSYYYTGGVHDAYDESHLGLPGAKILFETIPLADPAAPNLVQYASTLAFVNEPDLLVVCAGSADAEAGITVETHRRFFDQLLALTRSHQAELVLVGPPLIRWNGAPSLASASRPYAASLRRWSEENKIPYLDPNRSLLPDTLPYRSRDRGSEILARLEEAASTSMSGPPLSAFSAEARQRLGKMLFHSLIGTTEPDRYTLAPAQLERESPERVILDTTLAIDTSTPLRTHIFALGSAPLAETASTLVDITPSRPSPVRLELPSSTNADTHRETICQGRRLFSLLIIDPFRLEIHDLAPPDAPVAAVWRHHAMHNVAGNVEVHCEVHALMPGIAELPYELRYGDAKSSGTINLVGEEPAPIAWNFALPKAEDVFVVRGTLELLLGEGGKALQSFRHFEAVRQFGLNEPVALSPDGENEQAPETNPLRARELLFTAEATAGDLMLHFDFKNIALAPVPTGPVIELDLAIDARSHLERNRLGFVGNLHVAASPDDGPAEVGPFAAQAHFGNGYARRPLPIGTRALLSTRPNGTRRLTVHTSRGYFYRHPWSLGNGNSQLGINATIKVRENTLEEAPTTYRLAHSPLHPANAESLAVLELTEKSTRRWSLRFW